MQEDNLFCLFCRWKRLSFLRLHHSTKLLVHPGRLAVLHSTKTVASLQFAVSDGEHRLKTSLSAIIVEVLHSACLVSIMVLND